MIFIQGLPRELLHPKLLQRRELFGQYGTIKKISIGKASYSQIGRSRSVNITFSASSEAAKAVICTNHFLVNKKRLRVSFGMSKFCYNALLGRQCLAQNCDFVHKMPRHAKDVFKIKNSGSFQHLDEAESLALLRKWSLDLDWVSSESQSWNLFPSIYQMRPKFRKLERL